MKNAISRSFDQADECREFQGHGQEETGREAA
jgi:hypothetical protein